MIKVDTKLMNFTLASLCKPGEKPIYPVLCTIRQTGNLSMLLTNKLYGFIAVTNMGRLMVAEFSTPGVLVENVSVPLRNIKAVKTDKSLFGNMTVKIDVCDQGVNSEINLVFAQNENVMDFPYQEINLDGLLNVLRDPEKFCKFSDSARKAAEQQKEAAKLQNSNEQTDTKKADCGPDPVAMMNKEKEYVLSLCKRLEAKYGKSEFGSPLTETEISAWEKNNQVKIPDDLREWLKFAGESRLQGIPLEFYALQQFHKEQDYVVIGRKEDLPIAFVTDTGKYITIDGNSRRNLGYLETILRFWGYDAKRLFKDEELEKLRPVIEEEAEKRNRARQNAGLSGAGVREAMEYFLIRNNIGYLYKWQTYPTCPLRKELVDCGLVISEPDREGYYQWKPVKQTKSVDFAGIEARLGFPLHRDIKELVSGYFYFMLEGEMKGKSFHIHGLLPTADIESFVTKGFEKENYAGNYDYIIQGHFFLLGGACIDGDDSFALELNNDNGEILAVEYMDQKHVKFADSLYDLFMNSTPVRYEETLLGRFKKHEIEVVE